MSAPVKITYYLEVLSSWCHWVEPTWSHLKTHYAGRVDFQWKIALMNHEDFPASQEQCDWFYQRSGTVVRSPYKLNSGWFEADRKGNYPAPNLVAEAGKDFLDPTDDRLRLALTAAAVQDGKKIGKLTTAIEVASRTFADRAKTIRIPIHMIQTLNKVMKVQKQLLQQHGHEPTPDEVADKMNLPVERVQQIMKMAQLSIDAKKLRAAAESPAVRARVDASTAEFHAHRIGQRPAFVLESTIGDKAVFSGLTRVEPLAATIDAMLNDTAAYATHAAHFGQPSAR